MRAGHKKYLQFPLFSGLLDMVKEAGLRLGFTDALKRSRHCSCAG